MENGKIIVWKSQYWFLSWFKGGKQFTSGQLFELINKYDPDVTLKYIVKRLSRMRKSGYLRVKWKKRPYIYKLSKKGEQRITFLEDVLEVEEEEKEE